MDHWPSLVLHLKGLGISQILPKTLKHFEHSTSTKSQIVSHK